MSSRKNIKLAISAAQVLVAVLVALFVALGINALVSAQLVSAIPSNVEIAELEPEAPEVAQTAPNAMVYNRNLFNQAAGAEPAANPAEGGEAGAPAPETGETTPEPQPVAGQPLRSDLPLQLVGTMVSTDPRYSVAYLLDSEGKEHVTKLGQEPMEGAQLVRIRRTYVLFRRLDAGNRIEFLALQGKSGPAVAAGGSVPRNRNIQRADVTSARVGTAARSQPSEVEMRGGVVQMQSRMKRNADGVVVERAAVKQQAEHQQELFSKMQMEPMSTGGDRMGVRVGQVPPGSMFAGMGMQPGDVIVGVNGREISDPGESGEFLESLAAKGEAVMEIDRRGQKQEIRIRAE